MYPNIQYYTAIFIGGLTNNNSNFDTRAKKIVFATSAFFAKAKNARIKKKIHFSAQVSNIAFRHKRVKNKCFREKTLIFDTACRNYIIIGGGEEERPRT